MYPQTSQPNAVQSEGKKSKKRRIHSLDKKKRRKRKHSIALTRPSRPRPGTKRRRIQSGELKTAPRLAPKGREKLHIWLSRMLAFLSALICSPIITLINRRCKSASVQPMRPVPPLRRSPVASSRTNRSITAN